MHVERLLARYKHACPVSTPNSERFCASGLLSEWGACHSSHGGRSQHYWRADDLIADGAPLKKAKKATTNPEMSRGNSLFASKAWGQYKAAHPGQKFGQVDYYNYRSRAMKEGFKNLIEQQRQQFTSRARTPGFGMNPLASVEPMPPPTREVLFDDLLFGLGSERTPLRAEVVESLLEEITGNSKGGGFSCYEGVLRKMFVDRIFVKDEQAIPASWKNDWFKDEKCSWKHPGLCSTDGADIFPTALELVGSIRRFLKGVDGALLSVHVILRF